MTPLGIALALVLLLAGTAALGVALTVQRTRVRPEAGAEVVDPHLLGVDGWGESATLLQFSTELCARCPGVRRTLSAIAERHPGVRHVEVDLTHRSDIAKRFRVLQTPTILLLDGSGAVRTRAGGAVARDVLELELTRITRSDTRV